MRAALYARVSKADASQDPENQLIRLREYAKAQGWDIAGQYVDYSSGADAHRPQLDMMIADARARRFDIVLCVKVDRLARSVANLYATITELDSRGVKFECTDQAISTNSPTGKLLLSMLAGVAEFERELISERTKAGLVRAVAQGKRLGHPPLEIDMGRVRELRAAGWGYRRIARELGVSHQTIKNRLRIGMPKAPSGNGQNEGA